jgi:hypothetical protein
MIDAPDREEPRFPPDKENMARKLIQNSLEDLATEDCAIVGYASAAPGADILFHEVCKEMGISSAICLPMPPKDFSRLVFSQLESWRTRFLDLQNDENTLVLSGQAGLPNWLHGSNKNPWERGNHWVMQMALVSDAQRISALALWDKKGMGDAPGGTAQFVQLAEDAGTVHINIIDANQLLD